MYSENDYLADLKAESEKGKISLLRQVKAKKSHTCEKCGCEIPIGEYYYIYKPVPTKKYWFTWRKRCIDCKPQFYEEVNYYEDHNSKIAQINIRIDFKRSYVNE